MERDPKGHNLRIDAVFFWFSELRDLRQLFWVRATKKAWMPCGLNEINNYAIIECLISYLTNPKFMFRLIYPGIVDARVTAGSHLIEIH
jgi:hypothetical protein